MRKGVTILISLLCIIIVFFASSCGIPSSLGEITLNLTENGYEEIEIYEDEEVADLLDCEGKLYILEGYKDGISEKYVAIFSFEKRNDFKKACEEIDGLIEEFFGEDDDKVAYETKGKMIILVSKKSVLDDLK